MIGCAQNDCTCGGSCHGGSIIGGHLGALTPDQAVETIFPQNKVSSTPGHTADVRSQMVESAGAGQIEAHGADAYVPGSSQCAATGQSGAAHDLSLATGIGGTGLQLVAKAFPGLISAGPAGWIALGVSTIVGLFSTLLNHHAQAVKREQSILCSAVPAANNYLRIIDQAVANGQATPNDAIAALHSLENDFESQVSSIIKGSGPASSGSCNAACVIFAELQAIVAYKASQYQDLAAGAAQQVSSSRPNTTGSNVAPASSYASFYGRPAAAAPSGSSDWLPIAAVAVGAFLFLRGMA